MGFESFNNAEASAVEKTEREEILESFVSNPKFGELKSEAEKYLDLKEKLASGSDMSVSIDNVKTQEQKMAAILIELKNELGTPDDFLLSAKEIIKM